MSSFTTIEELSTLTETVGLLVSVVSTLIALPATIEFTPPATADAISSCNSSNADWTLVARSFSLGVTAKSPATNTGFSLIF